MAIFLDTDLQIMLNMRLQNQVIQNVWSYNVFGTPLGVSVTAPQLGQAWWNHVKAVYRALVVNTIADAFQSVTVRVVNNPTGDLGEYAIPPAEQVGTRSPPAGADVMPSFNAGGVRLTVDTRATRPGQKRIPFILEQDSNSGLLTATYTTLIDTLMTVMTAQQTLGAPAALFVLQPKVFRLGPSEIILAAQNITGWVTNPAVTSQVSRKLGRGI